MQQWEADGTYRFDRVGDPRPGVRHRHAAAHRQRLAAHRPRVQLHPHRHHRPLPAHERQGRLLPDRVGRQRPRHRASRPELHRRPLRPVAAVRSTGSSRRSAATSRRTTAPIPVEPPNFVDLCQRDHRATTRPSSRTCSAASACPSTGRCSTPPSATTARRVSQRAFLRNLARGEAYQQDAPTLYDIDERTAVAQAEMEDRDMPGAYHQLAFHRTRRWRRLVIDTTRPELLPAASPGRPSRRPALPAAVRHHGAHAAVRRRGARSSPITSPTPRRAPASR